jgi:hypothetical protein
MRRPMMAVGLMAGWTIGMSGCANLEVHKIPVEKRMEGCDHADGFRYYLSRPYVLVKAPIQVATQKSLVTVEQTDDNKNCQVSFLDGARQGQQAKLSELSVTSPGSPEVRKITAAEVAELQQAIRDPAVQRTGADPLGGGTGTDMSNASDTASNTKSLNGISLPGLQAAYPKTNPSPPRTSDLGPLSSGNISIVYLPDLDEQYAVKSKNCLSKSSFGLIFTDGWQLSDVNAEHDSTPVAIELLNTIKTAVQAAEKIAEAAIPSAPPAPKGGTPNLLSPAGTTPSNEHVQLYYLTQTTYIKPGLYRLNKPWETEGGQPMPVGCGLLAKLGLTTVTEVQLTPFVLP